MFDMGDEPEMVYGHAANSMDVDGARRDSDIPRDMVCTLQHKRRLANWLQHGEVFSTNSNHSPAVVKVALSLFKVQQSIYLLDFQRIEVRIS